MCSVESDRIIQTHEIIKADGNVQYLINILNTVGYTGHKGTAQIMKNKILSKIMGTPNNIFNIINCENNVTFFVESLDVSSYTIDKTCECKTFLTKHIPFIYFNIENASEFFELLNKIEEIVKQKKRKCQNGHLIEQKYTFNDVIYIQVTFFNESNTLELCQVPTNIVINKENFKLKGVVNFKPPKVQNGIGHYQCYSNRAGVWEIYDNSSNKALRPEKKIIPHLLTYVKDSKFN